ncbi:MAG: efflux RND transporter periplasmic adaptor subunit [Candidatus Sumerlaeia bacterium]|nr:efflux RND transporter periplasmic adaptor subunit [Candidatus Sumerlaeia bacterium]
MTVQPKQETLERAFLFTGNLEGIEQVEIRPRVQGFVEAIHFLPDSLVEKGELLFTIDPKPYQAALDSANARLLGAQADLEVAMAESVAAEAREQVAKLRLDRAKSLSLSQAVPEQEVDDREAEFNVARAEVGSAKAGIQYAKANVESAKADVATAELNLGYTRVNSPIEGRIGRNLVDLGALVGTNEPTLLATVINDSQVYAYFTTSESELFTIRRWRAEQGLSEVNPREAIPAFLALPDESDFVHPGAFDAADNQLEAGSGTMLGRARFDNPTRLLIPGAYVRLRIPLEEYTASMVPEVSISRDQGGNYILLVREDNTVERLSVETGEKKQGWQEIRTTLPENSRVITQGLLLARPGSKVIPNVDERFSTLSQDSANSPTTSTP